MKTPRLVVCMILVASLAGGSLAYAVEARTLTDNEAQRLAVGCVEVQTQLQRIYTNDGPTRSNTGQHYESQYQQLMRPFNRRAALNNSPLATQLRETTDEYRRALTAFRENYITYHQQLSKTVRHSCNANPREFYQHIESTRETRAAVRSSVDDLDAITAVYRELVTQSKTGDV